MINAFAKAFGQLSDKRTRGVVWKSLFATIVIFILLLTIVSTVLGSVVVSSMAWLDATATGLGVVATLVLTWFLFPSVAILVVGFLLEDVAVAVEARHYPTAGMPRKQPLWEVVTSAAKFAVISILLNIPVLFFLFIPPLFPFVFYGVNGYLFGREYFELVAHRRADAKTVRAMRRRMLTRLLPAGALIAFLMTIPVVNLVAPVIGAAAMVHLFQQWRAKGLFPELA
ncbi:MAG: EI24 domain-containing protein [Magnetospiraceae bacterium]